MRKFRAFTFLLLLGITLKAFSQGDPEGVLDSVYIDCGKNGYFGSGLSQVHFQLRYGSDNTDGNKFAGMHAVLKISGANIVSADTTVAKAFTGTALENFSILSMTKEWNSDPKVPPYYLTYGAVSFHGGVTGESLLANIVVTVDGTGTICIDSVHPIFDIPQLSSLPNWRWGTSRPGLVPIAAK